jgi:hypothetical protein
MSILKNFRNPWEADNWVLQTDVLDTDILKNSVLEDNLAKLESSETDDAPISGFRDLEVTKELQKYKSAFSKEIGNWHSQLMKKKLYPKAIKRLDALYSLKWYRPEVHYSSKKFGGSFYDERGERDGSYDRPYGIVIYTERFSVISDSKKDVLFEEIMHAILHRHYTSIDKREVNYLYEELTVRVLEAYAGVYHPKEYKDYYMKGFMETSAVETYFRALEQGKKFEDLEQSVQNKYEEAFNNLRFTVWRHYIQGTNKEETNNEETVTIEGMEDFLIYMIK